MPISADNNRQRSKTPNRVVRNIKSFTQQNSPNMVMKLNYANQKMPEIQINSIDI